MNATPNLDVLLLEDIGQYRAGFSARLEKSMLTINIHEAANYDQAIDILSNVDINFAFLDIDLSGASLNRLSNIDLLNYICKGNEKKTGVDVLRYIMSKELRISVTMLSDYDDKALVDKCLDEGASGYIPKSLEGENVLYEAIESIIFKGRLFVPLSIMSKNRGLSLKNKTLADFNLTDRESELLYYICLNDPFKVIAKKMDRSHRTLRSLGSSSLYKKFSVKDRKQLKIKAAELGIDTSALFRCKTIQDTEENSVENFSPQVV